MTERSPPPNVAGFGPNEGPPPGGYGAGGGYPPPAGAFGAPPGGFGSPPGGFGVPSGSATELERNAKLWLALALGSSVVCGGGCLLSLTGAVMCFLAQKAAEQGHLADADQKLRWGQILTAAGIAIGVLVLVGVLFLRD